MSPAPTKIDWTAAQAFYLSLGGTRSYGKVARRFGVSDVAVGERARREMWRERAREHDSRMLAEVEQRVVRERSVRIAEALNAADLVVQQLREQLESGKVAADVGDLPAVMKMVQLLEGEATERVEVNEVKTVILAVVEAAGRYVPRERRLEFLADLRAAAGPFAALEAGDDA